MKRNFRLYALALVALLTGGVFFSACTTGDDGVIREDVFTLEPVKAPKIIAYSGTNYFGGKTRGTDMNANMWNQNWDCPPRPAEDLTPEELAELKALLSPGKYVENEVIIPFENYYVQQIYKGEDRYNTHDRCEQAGCNHVNSQEELGSGHMDLLLAYNEKLENEWDIYDRHKFNDGIYEHVKNFNDGNNTNTPGQCGCGESHFGTTLMTNMSTEGVTPNNQFGFHETFGTAPKYYNNYIIVEYKGYYYVGFDYEAHKNDQTTHNHGEGMDIERDWNFTDWIVRITPAYPKGTTPKDNPGGVPNPGDNGDDNGDEGSETPETPETPDQPGDNDNEGDETPETPEISEWTDEVEVNLAIDEKKADEDLASHLSVHVRAATDIDIFIPMPEDFLFENDDLAIYNSHAGELGRHGGPDKVEYKIGSYTVTLHYEYLSEGEPATKTSGDLGITTAHVGAGIHVWTEDINKDVIDYCLENYNDGITFEVWNYFDTKEATVEKVKEYLNQAIITFLDKEPDAYINAFTEDEKGDKSEHDCTVSINEEQSGDYDDLGENSHYNGSKYNEIYKNNQQ